MKSFWPAWLWIANGSFLVLIAVNEALKWWTSGNTYNRFGLIAFVLAMLCFDKARDTWRWP